MGTGYQLSLQAEFSPFTVALTIVFGLAAGSFMNVCIYRIPRKGSISKPRRSYCPHCQHTLSALDNIPVLSYIFLRGKCRYCKGGISPQYIIVELLTAGIFVVMLYRSLTLYQDLRYAALEIARTFIFVGFLIVISFIDLEFTIIPDKAVYSGLSMGFLLAVAAAVVARDIGLILSRLLGALIGAGIVVLIAVVGGAILRKEAMGGGDVKLMGMIGIYLGWWPHIPITLVAASFLGSIIGIALILVRRKKMQSAIPFGPFLAIGALLSLLCGEAIWAWYQGLMGL
jgi:leader peptidase (prepilin peptidase)/N-methyltransferase